MLPTTEQCGNFLFVNYIVQRDEFAPVLPLLSCSSARKQRRKKRNPTRKEDILIRKEKAKWVNKINVVIE